MPTGLEQSASGRSGLSNHLVRCRGILAIMLATFGVAHQTVAQVRTMDECPSQHQIAGELLRAINAIRAEPRQCGAGHYPAAPKLAWNETLFQVAQQHAADMARRGYFSHDTPEGLTPGERTENAGYTWISQGENIAVGYTSVKDVLNSWLASPMHCRGIMNDEFRDVALACAEGKGNLLWTLELGLQRTGP